MILGCKQQKRTLANLRRKGIYWEVIVALRIEEEAIEPGSKNGQEPKKAEQARMPPGSCIRMVSLACSCGHPWRWTTCCWWYRCHHIQLLHSWFHYFKKLLSLNLEGGIQKCRPDWPSLGCVIAVTVREWEQGIVPLPLCPTRNHTMGDLPQPGRNYRCWGSKKGGNVPWAFYSVPYLLASHGALHSLAITLSEIRNHWKV